MLFYVKNNETELPTYQLNVRQCVYVYHINQNGMIDIAKALEIKKVLQNKWQYI